MRIARLAALLLVASCRNVLEAGGVNPTGTYTLTQLDGIAVPARFETSTTLRGSIELKSDAHYTLVQTDSATSATNVSATGTWSISENALQLRPDGGGLLLGIFLRDTVRMDYRGHMNTYVKH